MDESSIKNARFVRWLVLFSRSLIFLLLLIAIASPYSTEQKEFSGDPRLTILVDDSSSMNLYDTSFVESLKKTIEQQIPVKVRHFGSLDSSPISDTLLQYLGDKNILLVSDGNNYAGKSLDDIIVTASSINTTVSAISLQTDKKDAAITIIGPSETVEDVETPLIIGIDKVNLGTVPVKIRIDDTIVFDEPTDKDEISLVKKFPRGVHKITAEIAIGDMFSQNNVYYKSINVVKKPKILFVSKDFSNMGTITKALYEADLSTQIPANLEDYLAVVLNNLPASDLPKEAVDKLSSYVSDGNGLVLFGGKNSFDEGNYKGSYLETLLPVTIGTGQRDTGDAVSVVLLIDISGSTSAQYGGSEAVDVEKAIAIDILRQLRDDNYVGVIAFNNAPFIIARTAKLAENELDMIDSIKRLQNGGGTFIEVGIKSATSMLAYSPGSRNIILLSDGKTKNYYGTLSAVKEARRLGIRTFAVDVGANTDKMKLQEIASEGGGEYFKPGVAQSIRLLFGEDEKPKDSKPLMINDDDHFITREINLTAVVYGFNQVVPKGIGKVLVSTVFNDPVLTVGRFGLGRIAVFSTDDGAYWGGDLLKSQNSKIISRAINWAIGNPNKKESYFVSVDDGIIAEQTQVLLKSSQPPQDTSLHMAKIGELLYQGYYTPTKVGFDAVLGRDFAVNNQKEYLFIGQNPDLKSFVENTGGAMFSQTDSAKIIEHVKATSKITKVVRLYYRFQLIIAALVILIIEITIRRFMAYKKAYK